MPVTLKPRKTPWDEWPAGPSADGEPACVGESFPPCPDREAVAEDGYFCLRGVYVYDPSLSTRDDFRQFLWAGLRTLRREVCAAGLSDRAVHGLLSRAFDTVHDASDGLWSALRAVATRGAGAPATCRERAATPATVRLLSTPTPGGNRPEAAPEPDADGAGGEGTGRTDASPAGDDPVLVSLRRAFLRQSKRTDAYRARRDRELAELDDD